jgi:DNA-binding Lrp family transcriptional regulator
MANDTSSKIIEYISKNSQASGKELADYLELTDRAVRKQLKKLWEERKISKIGRSPKVFYRIVEKGIAKRMISNKEFLVGDNIKNYIDQNYINITSAGERKEGWEGFVYWCQKTKQDIKKMADDYFSLMEKYESFKAENGLISGMRKMRSTFSKVYLDELFYIDFYSIERFGKTKLGQLLLYAKQSQDKKIIKEISQKTKEKVEYLIGKFKIDGIGYIPPTVRREVQIMKELQRYIKLPVRIMSISKIKTEVAVPQKTLNKLADRVENAQKTFVIEDTTAYSNILLIDDAVGSGATLNEIARKIREKNICKGKIIGLVITGSFKGFDVISEV